MSKGKYFAIGIDLLGCFLGIIKTVALWLVLVFITAESFFKSIRNQQIRKEIQNFLIYKTKTHKFLRDRNQNYEHQDVFNFISGSNKKSNRSITKNSTQKLIKNIDKNIDHKNLAGRNFNKCVSIF
jgi:hypothetical protein